MTLKQVFANKTKHFHAFRIEILASVQSQVIVYIPENARTRPILFLEGTVDYRGRVLAMQPEGLGSEPDPNHRVMTLGKLFTHDLLCIYESSLCE